MKGMSYSKEHFRETVLYTPFYSRASQLNVVNAWHRWSEYSVPTVYEDVAREYFAIRNACSVFDLSPMHIYRVSGPQALPFLNRLVTREVEAIAPGRVGYCLWCTDSGHVIEDGTLFHFSDGHYWLCAQEEQSDWLSMCGSGLDVELRDDTHRIAALALQGPTSATVLRRMGISAVETLRPFQLAVTGFHGAELVVSRTGFTGDLGYELWTTPNVAERLWDEVFQAGADVGVRAIGSQALDIARIEAGFIQGGVDYIPGNAAIRPGRGRTPEELGLGFLVNFEKDFFNGKRVLAEERGRGPRHSLLRLEVAGNRPANDALILDRWGRAVGSVTSAVWSPSAKSNIAIATIDNRRSRSRGKLFADIYYQRELQWSRVKAPVTVRPGRFFDPARRRQTPPSNY